MRRVLTYRWHVGHQYELWKLPFDFTLAYGKTEMTARWDYNSRHLHSNVMFKRIDINEDLSKYDLAILHFDEFALRAKEYGHVLPSDWGEQFRFIMENYKGPKIAICHGVPIYKGTYDINYNKPDLGEIIEEYRKELVEYLGDILVICNSHQAQKEWGFKKSKVIWHGFDPLNYPQTDYTGGIITVCGGMFQRHHYRGLSLYKDTMEKIGWKADYLGGSSDDLPNKVKKPFLTKDNFYTQNEWAIFNFNTYVQFLRKYSIFFNPTLRSPMPRSRGEAMMCGLTIVTPDNHDASMFIENGYNGFLANDSDEISLILIELSKDYNLRKKIGERGRKTAIEYFHINNYLREWQDIIKDVVGKKYYQLNQITKENVQIKKEVKRHYLMSHRVKGILYVSGVSGGTNRYRVDNSIEALQKEGQVYVNNLKMSEINSDSVKRFLLKDVYDVVVCHRVGYSKQLETLVHEANKKKMLLIYDTDDLIHEEEYAKQLVDIGRKSYEDGIKDVEIYKKAIMLFNNATCTTKILQYSLKNLGIQNVEILPNTFSDKLLTMSNAAFRSVQGYKNNRKGIVVGYPSGSATHDKDLEIAVPAIKKILSEYSNVELWLMGHIKLPSKLDSFSNRIKSIPIMHWLELPYTLSLLDISIAPLQMSNFCNAKSNIKYIESALVRVPIVASNTEPYVNSIQHGSTGFIASNEKEWYEYLKILIENKQARYEIGNKAFEDVVNKYSSDAKLKSLLSIFTEWLKS